MTTARTLTRNLTSDKLRLFLEQEPNLSSLAPLLGDGVGLTTLGIVGQALACAKFPKYAVQHRGRAAAREAPPPRPRRPIPPYPAGP